MTECCGNEIKVVPLSALVMSIPINIEKLLGGNTVENNRIELKGGWNPDSIYRTICAFANDFEDNGSGYIIVGVDEDNGRPVRPVRGVPIETIDRIEKEMVGFNNLFEPFYMPVCPSRTLTERRLLSFGYWQVTVVRTRYQRM